ncbi:hypothetical protein MJO28_008203 [Puccinia striiformis f. sp. tritici]|uniref:Uncharacterized protein n=1 Tax=Puccinia striiformis f. sp. tritici TaxID=168172 RepID=A0ACC0E9U7_9BASI|nr:hypothetical protein MJO28_008203 [Puccinia striiformis f. sp. tritici]
MKISRLDTSRTIPNDPSSSKLNENNKDVQMEDLLIGSGSCLLEAYNKADYCSDDDEGSVDAEAKMIRTIKNSHTTPLNISQSPAGDPNTNGHHQPPLVTISKLNTSPNSLQGLWARAKLAGNFVILGTRVALAKELHCTDRREGLGPKASCHVWILKGQFSSFGGQNLCTRAIFAPINPIPQCFGYVEALHLTGSSP